MLQWSSSEVALLGSNLLKMIKQAGDLIAGLDLDDPSAVRKAVPYEGGFPPLGPPTPVAGKVHQRCAFSIQAAQMVLAGYAHDIDDVRGKRTVHIISAVFANKEIMKQILASIMK
jgi:hypothetical protein